MLQGSHEFTEPDCAPARRKMQALNFFFLLKTSSDCLRGSDHPGRLDLSQCVKLNIVNRLLVVSLIDLL